MQVKELNEKLPVELFCEGGNLEQEVTGGYCSDLLSVVMSRAGEGNVWITLQGHPNIVAVAVLVNLAAIIVTENSQVDDETVEKAREEGVIILTTDLSSYEIAGKLYNLGIHGEKK